MTPPASRPADDSTGGREADAGDSTGGDDAGRRRPEPTGGDAHGDDPGRRRPEPTGGDAHGDDPTSGGAHGNGAGKRRADAGAIVHVTTPAAWAEAQRAGALHPPSLATEGFAHCSTRAQLPGTLARHFPGADPLVALVLDPARLTDLRWEESRPGERFPHVYAPIAVDAVLAVEPLR